MTGLSPQPPYFRHAAANTPSDNQEVITALRRGLLSADCRNASGVTLLLCAVLNQNFSLAEYLLTHTSADPFASSKFGLCAAGVILSMGPTHLQEMVKTWSVPLTAAPNVGIPVCRGIPKAALLGQEQEIERLIRLGAPLEERDAYGFSPLCLSVLNGLPDSTQMLLDAGASPEAEQTLEFISIDRWVQQFPKLFNIPGLLRNVELAARLLPSNRVKSISRYLPIGQDCIRAIASIFELAERNQTNGLAKLLDLGVPPDLTDSKGQTIWSKLSDQDAGDSIRFLAKRVLGKAAPLSPATMEIIAASAPELTAGKSSQQTEQAEQHQADPHDARAGAKVLDALRKDDAPALLLLVAEGIPLNEALPDGRLPLEAAMELDAGTCFLLLLLNGASPDQEDARGRTVRQISAIDGKTSAYRHVIDSYGRGARLHSGESLDKLLNAVRHWETMQAASIAVSAPDLLWKTNRDGQAPLPEAAKFGNYKLLEVFLDLGADPWQIDDDLQKKLLHTNVKAASFVDWWKERLIDLLAQASEDERTIWSRRLPWVMRENHLSDTKPLEAQSPASPASETNEFPPSTSIEDTDRMEQPDLLEPGGFDLIREDDLSSLDSASLPDFDFHENTAAAPPIGGLAPDLELDAEDGTDLNSESASPKAASVAVPPSASSLSESLRGLGYSLGDAVADIVDNSIAAASSTVWIAYSPAVGRDAWLSIRDNGCGMDEAELLQAMKLGSISPVKRRSVKDLGRFGLGLKTASFSQCRRLTVCSVKNGKMHAYAWDLDELSKSDGWNLLRIEAPEKDFRFADLLSAESGTVVLWEKIDRSFGSLESSEMEMSKNRRDALSRLEKHLRLTFHLYLADSASGPELKLLFGPSEIPLQPWDPFFSDSFFHPVNFASEQLPHTAATPLVTIHPYVIPAPSSDEDSITLFGEEDLIDMQGFFIYRGKRLICRAGWLNLGITRSPLYALARIKLSFENQFDLDWQLDIRKSTVKVPRKKGWSEIKRILGLRADAVAKKSEEILSQALTSTSGEIDAPDGRIAPQSMDWWRKSGSSPVEVDWDSKIGSAFKTAILKADTPQAVQGLLELLCLSHPSQKNKAAFANLSPLARVAIVDLTAALAGYNTAQVPSTLELLRKTPPFASWPAVLNEFLDEDL